MPRKYSKIKDFCLLVLFLLLIVTVSLIMCGAADRPGAELVTETYTVCKGDTLDSIADKFMLKNTYGARSHGEFKEGIVEGNGVQQVKPGDKLTITYWIRR